MNREKIETILELARWAPSGDNTQPWRFEIPSEDEILVHGYDTRDHCVYDLDGRASQVAHGALLETLALAATRYGCRAAASIVRENVDGHVVYRVLLTSDTSAVEDPLVGAIRERTVQRLPMRMKPIPLAHRQSLEQAAKPYSVAWFESRSARWRMSKLNARSAEIRLTIPEAFAVHQATIAWGCETSEDRMPGASLGANRFLLALMRGAMSSWERVEFLNRYAGGTLMPRLALDVVPGIFCSAHFALVAPEASDSVANNVASGRAVQRFWLTATRLGLQVQPGYTPLIFASYARQKLRFTRVDRAIAMAREIADRLDRILDAPVAARTVFLGRLGWARSVKGRSLRLPLERLIVATAPAKL